MCVSSQKGGVSAGASRKESLQASVQDNQLCLSSQSSFETQCLHLLHRGASLKDGRGKHKYVGPFTSKQVEEVKAFWGILKVLLSIGPAFDAAFIGQPWQHLSQ